MISLGKRLPPCPVLSHQPLPVLYTVHAVVTTSDLTFDLAEVDFGHCSVRESVRTGVRLSNRSLLPQDYGFTGGPEVKGGGGGTYTT